MGDKVSFRVATNLAQAKAAERMDGSQGKFGGRRATEVSLVKYIGRVASLVSNGSYGFVDYEHERGMSHIFFHCSEVDKTSELRVNDLVQFVRVYNPNKQQHQARRVRKINDGQVAPKPSPRSHMIPLVPVDNAPGVPNEPEIVRKKVKVFKIVALFFLSLMNWKPANEQLLRTIAVVGNEQNC